MAPENDGSNNFQRELDLLQTRSSALRNAEKALEKASQKVSASAASVKNTARNKVDTLRNRAAERFTERADSALNDDNKFRASLFNKVANIAAPSSNKIDFPQGNEEKAGAEFLKDSINKSTLGKVAQNIKNHKIPAGAIGTILVASTILLAASGAGAVVPVLIMSALLATSIIVGVKLGIRKMRHTAAIKDQELGSDIKKTASEIQTLKPSAEEKKALNNAIRSAIEEALGLSEINEKGEKVPSDKSLEGKIRLQDVSVSKSGKIEFTVARDRKSGGKKDTKKLHDAFKEFVKDMKKDAANLEQNVGTKVLETLQEAQSTLSSIRESTPKLNEGQQAPLEESRSSNLEATRENFTESKIELGEGFVDAARTLSGTGTVAEASTPPTNTRDEPAAGVNTTSINAPDTTPQDASKSNSGPSK